ncbi:MAG: peptidyl-prolyl cis-trans isomerase [Holosporales bacterium]|jgi:hypothetical protein|nr:peptidyl-prolyl cis-trans isomerase [Holosporales bacterium]
MNIKKTFFATLLSCLVFLVLFSGDGNAFSLIRDWFKTEETPKAKKPTVSDKKPSAHHPKKKKAKAEKPAGKTVVVFKDGATVTEDQINKDLEEVPPQLAAKMSYVDIRNLLAWKAAFSRVMYGAAKKAGILKDSKVKEIIDARIKTAVGLLLLEKKSMEEVTFEQAKKIYDKKWDEQGKNSKEFTLIAINTTSGTVVSRLKAEDGRWEVESLKKLLDSNKDTTKYMELGPRNQAMFPPEIVTAVKEAGKGATVGPFELGGAFMLFFVQDIRKAAKKEFTQDLFNSSKEMKSKEYVNLFMKKLYGKFKVIFRDLKGTQRDPFKHDPNKKDKGMSNLSKIKDTQVLANVGDKTVCVKDVKSFYKVDSLYSEVFLSMSRQFNISLEEVISYAVKVLVDDLVLGKEAFETKFNKEHEVVEKCNQIRTMEAVQQFIQASIKVTPEDTKKVYKKYIQSIPEEDKNDHEIAVKLIFFKTKEDASAALSEILGGDVKFSDKFNEQLKNHEAIDLGYIRKRGTPPELWSLVKKCAPGTCCKEIVEVNGGQFGVKGGNYAIMYTSDRRPISLPSLSDPREKAYFESLAFRETAVKFVITIMKNGVVSINGKSFEEWMQQKEYVHSTLNMLVGMPMSNQQSQPQ